MIEDARKIKEIYNCEYIVSAGELYPLQKWYNQLIDKTIDEITETDILRMMRQKEFIELAMSKALVFLRNNVFAGELYDGEILGKISELDASFLADYTDELKDILKDIPEKSAVYEWEYTQEREEFDETVVCLLKKII